MQSRLPQIWTTPRELLGEIPAEDLAAFEAEVRRRMSESARSLCALFSSSLIATWTFDLILYRTDRHVLGSLAAWRTAELMVFGATFVALGRRNQGRLWAPSVLAVTMICAPLVSGVALGGLGDLGQPFMHSLPMTSFCTMVLFAHLRQRVVFVGLVMTTAACSAWATNGVPLSALGQFMLTLIFAGLFAGTGGHILFALQRQAFLQERAIARRTDELSAANSALQAKVAERTDALRLLTAHSADALEQERARIAADLHEDLGQVLSAIRLEVDHAQQAAPPSGPMRDALGRFSHVLETTVSTSRRIASEARPRILEDFGLLAAVELLVEEFRVRHGCECKLILPPELETDTARSLALYRSVQECLTNVAKHAKAACVEISLDSTGDVFRLVVRDHGRGLPDGKVRAGAMGLLGMRERAWQFGGRVQVSSQPGEGTMVLVEIPVVDPPSGTHRTLVPAPLDADVAPM